MRPRTLSPNSPVLGIERSLQSLEDLLAGIRESGELIEVIKADPRGDGDNVEEFIHELSKGGAPCTTTM
jgi:hypothetical protein